MSHSEALQQFVRHTPRILRRQLILQLAEEFLTEQSSVEKQWTCKPSIQRFNGALLFVDISGFTALSLRLNVEELKNRINEYFTKILDIVDSHDGDVIKFAGDALFIIWECPEPNGMSDDSEYAKIAVEKAVECGREINVSCSNHQVVIRNYKPLMGSTRSSQDLSVASSSTNSEALAGTPRTGSQRLSPILNCQNSIEEEEVAFLNVHSGVSVGLMAGIDIGVENRWEYFLVGEPLSRVAEAESQASSGDLILCPETHELLHPDSKTSHFGIISAMRNLFRRASSSHSTHSTHSSHRGKKPETILLSCGCTVLRDGYCKLAPTGSPTTSAEKKRTQHRNKTAHSPHDKNLSTLELVRNDLKDVLKAFQPRFQKEFLKRSSKLSHSINSSEEFELCDLAIQRAFCHWAEIHLTDDIARHVHQVIRSEYTFCSVSRCGAYDRALEDHFRRTLMPACGVLTRPDLFDELSPSTRTPTRNSPLLSPISRNNSHHLSRVSSPLTGHTASPAHSAVTSLSPKGSRMGSESSILIRSQSGATDNSTSVLTDVSSEVSFSSTTAESRNRLVLSRLTARRRAEGNLLMPSVLGGIDLKNSLTAEIRTVAVMFVKLVMPPVELLVDNTKRLKMGGGNHFLGKSLNEKVSDQLLLDRFQSSIVVLSNALHAHGGQMRQFIVDDKGTVCIGTFGLRGAVSDDNAAAAMEAAHEITVKMQQMGLPCSIGVTVGKAYCGLVGSSSRHEYAVMGPSTNLSARLMSKAAVYEVICDGETRQRDRTHRFVGLTDISAKGYSAPVPTFKPIFPEVEALLSAQHEQSARVFRGLSLHMPFDDFSIRATASNVNEHRMIIERMIGSKNQLVFRDAYNMKVKLHGRVEEVRSAITYLLSELVDPVTAAAISPVSRPLFLLHQPTIFVGINGVQGSGKSCLIQCIAEQVATVAKCTNQCNIQVLRGRHDRLGAGGAPFCVWKNIIRDLIIRIHRVKKEAPRRRKSFVVGLAVTVKELFDAATFVLSVLPVSMYNFLPLLGYLGIVPPDAQALGTLALSPEDLMKACIDLQVAVIQMYVTATSNLVFLTMDDVHAFDDASLLLLMKVYAVAKGVVVLFTRRSSGPSLLKDSFSSDNGTVESQFASTLYEAGRYQAIDLEGLNKPAITALVKDVLQASKMNDTDESLLDKVFEVCGGNPFYAFEIAKSIVEKQNTFVDKSLLLHSVRIEEVICHRFDKLRNSDQMLLKMAAVACSNGSCFNLTMLNEIAGADLSSLSPTHSDLKDVSIEWKNAMILHSVLQNESFIGFADEVENETEMEVTPDMTVEMLLRGNYSFQFNVALEQSIIYNLLLDDQKHAIHQSIAEYYKHQRESEDASNSSSKLNEEGFHWESAGVMNQAMVCYYEAYVCDHSVPKNSEYLNKAFAMYTAMKESTELLPDPQGISFTNLQQLVEETFRNEGRVLSGEVETETLKLDRVFQIFDGDSSMLETALAIMLELCLQRIRRCEGSYLTQLILEDAIQMILLTKEPFLMSSKYLARLVNSVTEGVSRGDTNESMHFCLYDHFSHWCFKVFSAYLVNYALSHTAAMDYSKKAACIAAQFLQLTRASNVPVVHIIQALCLNALIQNTLGNIKLSLVFVDELRTIYVFEEHSPQLVEAYGVDHVIFLLTRTTKYHLLSSEPERANDFISACVKYGSQTSDVTTLTSCVFRIVGILSYANRYVDAQMIWSKYGLAVQLKKTDIRQQFLVKVLQLYSEWLSRRIMHLSHKQNPNISALGRETGGLIDLVEHLDMLMNLEHENAVFHFRHEVLLVFADICLLKISGMIESSVTKSGVESIESLCKACCKHLQVILGVSTIDIRDAFNKAYCVKIITQAVKLVANSQATLKCLQLFRSLFSSQVLLQLRNEAEINRLHTFFESLAALHQALYGQHQKVN